MAKKVYDAKTGVYIPTLEELGYTEQEVFKERSEQDEQLFNQEYDRRTEKFQREYERKRKELKNRKTKIKLDSMEMHWYSRLTHSEVKELLEDCSVFADEILDDFISKAGLESMAFYYNSLKMRIKSTTPEILGADPKKLATFPKLDVGKNKLFGSKYSFLKLWAHVYSVSHKRKPRGKVYNR